MKHLDDNNTTYILHMRDALTLARFGLKIVFYSTIHAIFPFMFTTIGGKTIEKANITLAEMRVKNSINPWDGF